MRALPHGYPVPFTGRDELLELVQTEFERSGVLSRGRFGGWRYESCNQDHRAVARASWSASRRCRRVLAHESPSAVAFVPSVYVDIGDTLEKKVAALQVHGSQVESSAMVSTALVRASAGYRGFRSIAAEGFAPHRFVIDV